MIEFLCPNEHKIRCPDDKAGRPAKCPKCGVSFRIPTLEELSLGASAIANEGSPGEEVTDMPAAALAAGGSGRQPALAATPSKERQIEFLCPNGHHLHGPATLQGRAGECPECGSRFRIPVVDEAEAEPESLLNPQVATDAEFPLQEEFTLEASPLAAQSRLISTGAPLEFLQVLDVAGSGSGLPSGRGAVPGEFPGRPSAAISPAATIHPLAALFVELWAARDEGSRVEVHLESGSVLAPDGYLRSFSLQDYAVLVTKDPDGSSTVTIVPWNSIARIILRSLKNVPGEVVR